jgi:hypothetical protein
VTGQEIVMLGRLEEGRGNLKVCPKHIVSRVSLKKPRQRITKFLIMLLHSFIDVIFSVQFFYNTDFHVSPIFFAFLILTFLS